VTSTIFEFGKRLVQNVAASSASVSNQSHGVMLDMRAA
jgi:hypothetical protein